jgi:hypothetical protein
MNNPGFYISMYHAPRKTKQGRGRDKMDERNFLKKHSSVVVRWWIRYTCHVPAFPQI